MCKNFSLEPDTRLFYSVKDLDIYSQPQGKASISVLELKSVFGLISSLEILELLVFEN